MIAERLVRRVCLGCSQGTSLSAEKLAYVRAIGGDQVSWTGFKRGTGCSRCNFTGYQGRIGIYELLLIGQELGRILGRGDSIEFADAARQSAGFSTLEQAALEAAMSGVTTIDEVMRITAEMESDMPVAGKGAAAEDPVPVQEAR